MLLADVRRLYVALSKNLSNEQLLHIPEGFGNNILWNMGHIVVTQQRLTYGLSGRVVSVSEEMETLYRKGSSPKMWQDTPDIEEVKGLLVELPERFASDYEAGLFADFKEYKLASTGTLLKTIDDAIAFNDFHEGLHLGTVLALRKLVL